jgi:peptidoglycan/LPS O-acetylase OafA/YrhL
VALTAFAPPDPRARIPEPLVALLVPGPAEHRAPSDVGVYHFRPDIEGLRAVAVLLVLAYHARLGPFTGGYVGVDVFFVLSGFLITSLLFRELRTRRTIDLPRFWARRARRLLAASCLVVILTLLVGSLVLGPLAQLDLARDALAASTFVINIVLAGQASDYLTVDLAPSPLLHFWSLALEEQFYLVWPVLLLLVARRRPHPGRAAAVLVGVAWVASLVACIRLTDSNQPWAFYSLPTRAWELLTGTAFALVAVKVSRIPALWRGALGWGGLAGIVLVALTFGEETIFPGPAAVLPVIATAAVVVGGTGAVRSWGPAALLDRRPLQWIGRHSYAIYLWHWPALVLMAAWLGPLPAWARAATVAGSVVAAAFAQRILEDPVRHSAWLAGKARRGLALGGGLVGFGVVTSLVAAAAVPDLVGAGEAAAPVLVVPATTAMSTTTEPAVTTTAPSPAGPRRSTVPTSPPARSPKVVAPATTTTVPGPEQLAAANAEMLTASASVDAVPANLRPALRAARNDLPQIYLDGCHLDPAVTQVGECAFGDPGSATTVVLFGDSHAAQWFPALNALAEQHRWRLVVLTKKGCPTAEIPVYSPLVDRELRECVPWRQNVFARIAAEKPDIVVLSSYRYRMTGRQASADPDEAWRRGLSATLAAVRPSADHVVVLGDTPTPAQDVPGCVSSHLDRASACVSARSEAVKASRLAVEQAVASANGAVFVPTGDWVCGAERCPVIVGDILLYRDANHLTATAATWLAPYLDAALARTLAGQPPVPATGAPAPPTVPGTTAPPTTVPPPPCAVSFVGDSVGTGTLRNGLEEALARHGCTLVFHAAYGGMKVRVGAERLGASRAVGSNVAITMLGFHNAREEVGRGRFPGLIDAVVGAAGNRLVVWPLLASTSDCSTGYKAALVRANEELHRATARWPNLLLVDYARFLGAHPEYSENRCPHLLSSGYRATAEWLAGEVRRAITARAAEPGPSPVPG